MNKNEHERRIRSKMAWALRERDVQMGRIFDENRSPTPVEWKEISEYHRIYCNCCELLEKFFQPKPEPLPKEELKLH